MVEIVTPDEVSDKDEMARNIARAIVNEAISGQGIVPEESNTYTEIVYVREWYSNTQIIEHTFKSKKQ
jgi:fructose-1,6-bisphosphatase/inositol monophosphatase family enzyme